MTSGWGGHNHLWCLATSHGRWAIKEVGREPSLDPDDTLTLQLAAYSGGIPMPRPIPTTSGRCFALLDGRRYRCHEWVDGMALPSHGHTRATAAAVGGMLARVHGLRLPWSSHLAPQHPSPGFTRWITLLDSARSCDAGLGMSLERALPSIERLETLTSKIGPVESLIGSHRDLHPSNVMRLRDGRGLVLVDWDAAGPVVPAQEVVCFALLFAERDNNSGYAAAVVRAFINGYRAAGAFAFTGCEDLAMLVQGRLWWTEQNLRMALAPRASADQRHLSIELLASLERLPAELHSMCDILFRCAQG
jgi:Ser/Thr protein kinase RdoA (MazF antagonist)